MNSQRGSCTAVAVVATVLTSASHLHLINKALHNDNNETCAATAAATPVDSFLKDSMHVRQNKRNDLLMPHDDDDDDDLISVDKDDDDDMEEDDFCEETERETDDELQEPAATATAAAAATATAAATPLAEPQPARTSSSSKQDQVPSFLVSSVCKNKNTKNKNNKTKKSVSFATNTHGTVICKTRLVSIHEKDDCWYRPEEKLAMQEHFSRVVLYYQSATPNDDGDNGDNNNNNNNDKSVDAKRAFVEALAKLQKDAHKLTMPEACQHLSTIALHTAATRGLESYVLSDEFDYMRQKHLLRILMAQNQLEEKFGMYEERQTVKTTTTTTTVEDNSNSAQQLQQQQDMDDIEDLIINELSRTSLRWSIRSAQFARLIALLDKHAAQEALSSPWQ